MRMAWNDQYISQHILSIVALKRGFYGIHGKARKQRINN
mgnify:CR=1 FL=1